MKKGSIFFFVFSLLAVCLKAEVRLPSIFSDHMVLQRNTPFRVWGWAEPKEKVTVRIGKNTLKTKADSRGNWLVVFPSAKEGPAGAFVVEGKDNRIEIEDAVFGEVWLCSGQSNMEFKIFRGDTGKNPKPVYPANDKIRYVKISRTPALSRQTDVATENGWQSASAETVPGFSAVAYFFADELQKATGMRIGLVDCSWGGSPVQAWLSREELEKDYPDLLGPADSLAKANFKAYLANKNNKPNRFATLLYNGMAAPIENYTVRGMIWYQGEANTGGASGSYYDLTRRLILSRRKAMENPRMPFLMVQLANYKGNSGWPEVQRQQSLLARDLPSVGTAVINDTGEKGNIHPVDKQTVGYRLSLLARKIVYGEKNLAAEGPVLARAEVRDGKMVLTFEDSGSPLACTTPDGKLKNFELAGADKKYRPASARIVDGKVVVSSSEVPDPRYVRYAYLSWPEPVNFYNRAGLPAGCFTAEGLR